MNSIDKGNDKPIEISRDTFKAVSPVLGSQLPSSTICIVCQELKTNIISGTSTCEDCSFDDAPEDKECPECSSITECEEECSNNPNSLNYRSSNTKSKEEMKIIDLENKLLEINYLIDKNNHTEDDDENHHDCCDTLTRILEALRYE